MSKLLARDELHAVVWGMVKERQGKSTSLIARNICELIESQKLAFVEAQQGGNHWSRETAPPRIEDRPLPAPKEVV